MTQPQIILKSFECYKFNCIEDWVPQSDDEVNYQLSLSFGPLDEEGEDFYLVQVVTPQSINRLNLGEEIASTGGKKFLVVSPYSWSAVLSSIKTILSSCAEETYDEATNPLAEAFDWEGDY